MPYFELRKSLAETLAQTLATEGVSAADLEREFTIPPNPELGHAAWPCFRVAKLLGTPPGKLAQELSSKIKSPDVECKPAGPYINFRWSSKLLFKSTVGMILDQGTAYGSDDSGKKRPVLIEFCSPNIAKPLFFHHIRSTLIGNVLANVYDFLGYKTEKINFVGDWGAQFARLVAAFELWGSKEILSSNDTSKAMAHLLEIYVRFHQELDSHPEYADKANLCLQKLESHHAETTELWKQVRSISLKAMQNTLDRLSVQFQHVEGESAYVAQMAPTLESIKTKAQAKISEGAWIVELDGISTPALIQKRDGTTLYLTRDIAAAEDRYQRFQFHKSYYVVSEQQKLHFQQLFATLKKMGCPWADQCEHISFGTVLFNSERMSTREGRAIYLDDVLNEAAKRALDEVTTKNPNLVNKAEVSEVVGIGAVIFGELSSHRMRDINFDWKHVLTLDGDTGPYVQYAGVRCQSIIEKAKEKNELSTSLPSIDQYGFSTEEDQLLLSLAKFRSVLHQVISDNEPYHLTHYLIDLAKAFNRFYYKFPVLQATDPIQKKVRLQFVLSTFTVLQSGLKLLGIACPKEM